MSCLMPNFYLTNFFLSDLPNAPTLQTTPKRGFNKMNYNSKNKTG